MSNVAENGRAGCGAPTKLDLCAREKTGFAGVRRYLCVAGEEGGAKVEPGKAVRFAASLLAKLEVEVGVVLDEQEVVLACNVVDLLVSRLAKARAGRVLADRDDEERPGFDTLLLKLDALRFECLRRTENQREVRILAPPCSWGRCKEGIVTLL